VGNCTLSLLPAQRFLLVRVCRCSPIRFRVFCSSLLQQRVSLPLPRSTLSPDRARCPFLAQLDFSPPVFARALCKKEDDPPGSPASVRPGPVSNLIIPRLIIRGRDENYASTIIFSRELSFPFTDDLTRHSITRLAQILRISRDDDDVVPYFILSRYFRILENIFIGFK